MPNANLTQWAKRQRNVSTNAFAPAKSKAMWFFGKNPNNNLQVGNLPVDWVSDFHYLGVVIDKHIRFHRHAQYIVDRTNAAANVLKVLSSLSGVNCFVLRRIFNATVRAILDYGSEIHNLMSRTQLNSMQRAQNSALVWGFTSGPPSTTYTQNSTSCQLLRGPKFHMPNS